MSGLGNVMWEDCDLWVGLGGENVMERKGLGCGE